MVNLVVMVGIQGSGKSTKARELAKTLNAVILSSDEIRKTNPSWDNNKVFVYLYDQMNNYLSQHQNVILDATNTTLKSRQAIFNSLRVANVCVAAHVMNTNEWDCRIRVEQRNQDPNEHYVPVEVIDRYLNNFQIPVTSEGFSFVTFENNPSFEINACLSMIDETIGFDQQNHHHTFDLYNHSARAGLSYGDLCVGLFHDMGKLFCKTFDDKGEAHYYNHANYGAYYLLTHLHTIPENKRTEVLVIANYHMCVYDWKSDKTHAKYKKLLGKWYDKLVKFHDADEGAH